jgi:PhnB protein
LDIDPYLSFDGRCAEAFDFYAGVLGGEVTLRLTWSDSPGAAECAPEDRDRIMHIRLQLGDRAILGGDAPGKYFSKPQGICVSLTYPTAEEARGVYAALSEGGQVQMPFAPTFWAAGFGMLVDRFAIPWMIGTSQAPAEAPA